MSSVTDQSITWHSSPRSLNGSSPHSWRATFRWTGSSWTTNQPIDRGIPRRRLSLRFSLISRTQLTQSRWRCSGCWTWVQPSTPWTTTSSWQVVRCRWNCTCMDLIIYPRPTAISHFQWPSIHTDSAEIRRAAGISFRTAPFHPVYLRCHLHCRITWCRSSLLCRRQPTLPPLPSRRQNDCRSQIGWMHQKSRGMDGVESAEAELRQDSILVAWIQTAVGEDRHKDHDDRWTLHQIYDFHQESRRDIRQWIGNGPACQQHHSKLFLSVETAEIHPTITFHGVCENIGPFPHIKSGRLLQQYLLRCH